MKKELLVISSFAQDTVFDSGGNFIRQVLGGPAFFISNILKDLNRRHTVLSGTPAKVHMWVKPDGQYLGKLMEHASSFSPLFGKLSHEEVLISGNLNNIQLQNLHKHIGRIFLDIQGYVRNPNDSSKHQLWQPEIETAEAIFCVKGNEKEMEYLPENLVQKQKKKLFIITKGEKGCEVHFQGKRMDIQPIKKIAAKDTIGAGDTFFAHFVHNFLESENAFLAAEKAVGETALFLSQK